MRFQPFRFLRVAVLATGLILTCSAAAFTQDSAATEVSGNRVVKSDANADKSKKLRVQSSIEQVAGKTKKGAKVKEVESIRVEIRTDKAVQKPQGGSNVAGSGDAVVTGKVVIIGSDGSRQEFDLTDLPDDVESLIPGTIEGPSGKSRRLQATQVSNSGQSKTAQKSSVTRQATLSEGLDPRQIRLPLDGPYIGVQLQPLTRALKAQLNLKTGVLVAAVVDGSPAARSGIQKFDVIAAADDQMIVAQEALSKVIRNSKGRPVNLEVIRNGKTAQITVTPVMATRPDSQKTSRTSAGTKTLEIISKPPQRGSEQGGVELEALRKEVSELRQVVKDLKAAVKTRSDSKSKEAPSESP